MDKNIKDLVNEFMSLKDMHLCEVTKRFNSPCTCDWCAYIVDELIYENFGIRLSRSCTMTREILKKHDDFITVEKNNIQVGDIVLYDWDSSGDCDHIGIICSVDNNKVMVCEGNIGNTDFTKSVVDIVEYDAYRKYYTTSVFRYQKKNEECEMIYHKISTDVTLTECSMKSGHKADKLLCQAMLHNYGYYTGLIDGVFGSKTLDAIRRFQANHSLKTDGVVGFDTYGSDDAWYGWC